MFSGKLGRLQGVEVKLPVIETMSSNFADQDNYRVCFEREDKGRIFRPQKSRNYRVNSLFGVGGSHSSNIENYGKVRICGDYRLTVNKVSKCDTYPIPGIEDLFARIAERQQLTILALDRAYQQLVVDEKSLKYVVIITHKKLF